MLQNASYVCFFLKRNKTKQKDYEKKEKSLTRLESNLRPSTRKGNPLRHATIVSSSN